MIPHLNEAKLVKTSSHARNNQIQTATSANLKKKQSLLTMTSPSGRTNIASKLPPTLNLKKAISGAAPNNTTSQRYFSNKLSKPLRNPTNVRTNNVTPVPQE